MRKLYAYLAAAALAGCTAAGLSYAADPAADPTAPLTHTSLERATNALRNTADAHTVRQVQRTVSHILTDLTTKDEFDDFVGYLSKANRDHIGKVNDKDFQDLDARIDQFQNAWHQKYNEYFGLSYYRDILDNIAVEPQGTDRAAVLLSDHPFIGRAELDNRSSHWTNPVTDQNTPKTPGAENQVATPNTDNTHTVAGAVSGAIGEAAATRVTLNLVNEGMLMNAWRLDLAQGPSAEALKGQLIQTFDQLTRDRNSWPGDKTQAYRQVAVRLLQSVVGTGNLNPTPTVNVR